MKTHPGYFTDSQRGQPWYRCLSCQYDTFLLENIRQHAQIAHPALLWPECDNNYLQGRTIGISLLTWNTVSASLHSLAAIARECRLLAGMGIKTRVFWVDNGSTDGTVSQLSTLAVKEGLEFTAVTLNADNLGQSIGRNTLLDAATAANCDFLLMVDGDIEIVPFSAFAFGNFLETAISNFGCVGAYCRNCTDDDTDADVPAEFRVLTDGMIDGSPQIAWTNYGMFRREVFSVVRFDTSGPFAGPGWGFEDDDYYLQMLTVGYRAVNTKWLRHLHRTRHSSLRLMDRSLAAKVYNERKSYLLTKWRDSTDDDVRQIIRQMANQTMPVVD